MAPIGFVEGLEHGVDHSLVVLSQDASGLGQTSSELVGSEVQITITWLEIRLDHLSNQRITMTYEVCSRGSRTVDDVVAVGIVGSGADGVSAADISGGVSHNGETSR